MTIALSAGSMSPGAPLGTPSVLVPDRLTTVLRWLFRRLEARHSVTLEGAEHLPEGPALLLGNQGAFGYQLLPFVAAVHRHTGLLPRPLVARALLRIPWLSDVLRRLGAAEADPRTMRELLGAGQWVVSYPGGFREAMKATRDQYRLAWSSRARRTIHLASELGVPILPVAAAGVDHAFDRRQFARAVPLHFRIGRPIPLPASAVFEHVRDVTQAHVDHAVHRWLLRNAVALRLEGAGAARG